MNKKHLQFIALIAIIAIQSSVYNVVAQEITLDMEKQEISCAGMNDGNARVKVSGGNAPYSYKWSNGEETSLINDIGSGVYTITVSDSNGNTALNAVSLLDVEPISVVLDIEDGKCGNLGKITAKVTGGLGPFQYNWSNGGFDSQIRNLEEGEYSLKVTDRGSCPTYQSADIIIHGEGLAIKSEFELPTCSGDGNGQISIKQTGGEMPIDYLWNNGSTGVSLSNVAAGTYSVFAIDAFGCTDGLVIFLPEPEPLNVDIINQSNSLLAKVEGGSPSYSYVWSNGATGTTVLSNLSPGTYGLTVDDKNGCTASDMADVLGPLTAQDIDSVNSFSLHSTQIHNIIEVKLALSFPQEISFRVYDQSGALINIQNESGASFNKALQLSADLPAGILYVHISSSEGWYFTDKVVKL